VVAVQSDDDRRMSISTVLEILSVLHAHDCRVWIAGGWGVDALVGRQTRSHRDLDVAVDAEHEALAVKLLGGLGYQVETDWRPARIELVSRDGWVDLHPVAFDQTGFGRQAGLNGGQFDYPTDAFTIGVLGGRPVPCLSRRAQIQFHSGYEPRVIDVYDLALLEDLRDE
jgi:lincosamide nucleotidyltransferase A/C/D/E